MKNRAFDYLDNQQSGYQAIKDLANETETRITDLIVLARQNDPFFAGAPAQLARAEWFADLWNQRGYANGVHLRRIHYNLVSGEPVERHDGKPYENTESSWNYLGEASKAARYLHLVPADAFEDRRNFAPHIYMTAPDDDHATTPGWFIDTYDDWYLPRIPTDLSLNVQLELPQPFVNGYDYHDSDQPYILEVWIEKSTLDDVLLPLCRRYSVNLVTSVGFQSVSNVIRLLERMAALDKPARILYIADFDPAGDGMPVGVARQIEYWLPKYAPGADVKLTPLALTAQQVREYRLPRIPVKDSDKRKAAFEERYGEGAVELDALEALYPGAIAEIVRDAILPYRDLDLAERRLIAESQARTTAIEAWRRETISERQRLEELEDQTRAILDSYQERLAVLAEQLDRELEPIRHELRGVRQAMQHKVASLDIDLPPCPSPETDPDGEDGWLFDASRDYLSQLAVYKNGLGHER